MGKEKWVGLPVLVFSVMFLVVLSSSFGIHSFGPERGQISTTTNSVPLSNSVNKPFPLNSTNNGGVNPNNVYSKEPAPMGLADYGIGPNNIPYAYNTTSFLGKIWINSLNTLSSNVTIYHTMSFQLNANLVYYNGGGEYVYWIQDVAILDTQYHVLYFMDNIWNNTNDAGNILNTSVSGNGFISSIRGHSFYLDTANESLPGGYVYMQNPSDFQLMVNCTVTKNGQPAVAFMYSDGYGWQTYDNVVFSFVNNLSRNLGFVVSGFDYEPVSREFYNVELVMGASFGGCTTSDTQSNLTLALQYWNGHNYQEIPSAFNFGSNTAETISNATSHLTEQAMSGIPSERITNGSGTLIQVYSYANVSFLNVSLPLISGTLYVNGTSIPYTGGDINLTLLPGSYDIEIYSNSSLYNKFVVNLTSNEYAMAKVNGTSVNLTKSLMLTPDRNSGILNYAIPGAIGVLAVGVAIYALMHKKRPGK